jgi:hypothetical protein
MSKNNCNIIKDLLPLYVDGVVSLETKDWVDEHLLNCDTCRQQSTFMQQEIVIPAERNTDQLQAVKKKWRNKKLSIAAISVLITSLLLVGLYNVVFHYNTFIPYSDTLIKIEEQDDGMLVSHYYGDSYYFFSANHPRPMIIDGAERQVMFIYYTKTLADSYGLKLFERSTERKEQAFMFPLDNKQNVDAIYYTKFDSKKIVGGGDTWEEALQDAVLLWEK